jgi:hypothetical protein
LEELFEGAVEHFAEMQIKGKPIEGFVRWVGLSIDASKEIHPGFQETLRGIFIAAFD